MNQSIQLSAVASFLGREVEGDAGVVLTGVASLEEAGEGDLAFVRSENYAARARASGATALIVPEGVEAGERPIIRSPSPGLDFARAARRLVPASRAEPGVHPTAEVDANASIHPLARVEARAVVGAGCRIGAHTHVHAHSVLYSGVILGDDCEVHAGVILGENTEVGSRVLIHPGVVIGADGFSYMKNDNGRLEKFPQLGRVVIEDDVEIGANSTIDRGTLSETRIRNGAKIDNMVHIAHNCDIGEDVIIAAQTGLSGSTHVGQGAILMGQVGSAGHLRVGERAFVGTRAGLHRDVPDGVRVWGSPQMEERAWHRSVAALSRLPGLLRRLRAVEKRLGLRRSRGERDADESE